MSLQALCRAIACTVATALAVTASAYGDVLIVDAGGGGHHTTIQAAVDAAGPEDVVFVLDPPDPVNGTYAGFQVDGRGLTIVSRIGAAWSIGASSVRNVPLGTTVRLVGLGIGSGNLDPGNHELFGEYAPYSPVGLAVTACAGAIRIESCTIAGSNGLTLSDCADVLVDRSSLSGSEGAQAAIRVAGSKVTLTASSVHGCKGRPGTGGTPGPFGSVICDTCVTAGPSGPAIVVNGAGAEVRASGSLITGGHAGVHHQCYQCDGFPASGVITDALGFLYARDTLIESGTNEYTHQTTIPYVGNVVLLPEPHRGLECPPLADVDGIVTPLVRGAPGEVAWLVVSENTGRRALVPAAGVVHFAPPFVEPRLFLGVFDASGELLAPIQLPVPAGGDVAEYTLQLATSGIYGTRLGAAVSVLVLGPDAPIAPLGASIHVDPLGHDGRSGRTWSTSVASVQNALERALGDLHVPSEVWLLTGTHRIADGGATPPAPLRARQGIGLRGGFAGHELRADERDPLTPNAVLTGDVLGDDAPGFMNRTDNVPGLLSDLTSLRPVHQPWLIERVTFRGAFAPAPSSTIAMWLHGDGSLSRCTFEDIDVASRLLYCIYGDVVLRHVVFRGNRASFVCGTEYFGGATTQLFELTNCLVEGNRVTADCISAWGSHVSHISLQVANSTIASNTLVASSGTALRGNGPISRVVNSLLWNNARAGMRDEAAQLRLPPAAQLAYTTVSGWTGALGGQGGNGFDPRFRDPLGPDGVPGTADDDLRLAAGSPAVDAGDTGRVPAGLDVDLDGRPRVVDDPAVPDTGVGGPPVVDRGAYER